MADEVLNTWLRQSEINGGEGTPEQTGEVAPLIPLQSVSLREDGLRMIQHQLSAELAPSERALLLNNLGAMLGEVGRREEALKAAEEAVEAYRRLAAESPEAYLPFLAGGLRDHALP